MSDGNNKAVKLDLRALCLTTPLYLPIELGDSGGQEVARLRRENFQFDAWCVSCKASTTFKTQRARVLEENLHAQLLANAENISVDLFCQRHLHRYSYFFRYVGKILYKVGQFPSLEDVASADIQKYRSVLRDGYFAELHRAGGLFSHGIGIGSFVYLRRIFEKLIYDHHAELIASGTTIDGFDTMRMGEKIQALASMLPPALVKHKAAYSILSVGLHELDEDTCRKYFPAVRAAIIQILDQDLAARQARLAEAELEKELLRIQGELDSPAALAESTK